MDLVSFILLLDGAAILLRGGVPERLYGQSARAFNGIADDCTTPSRHPRRSATSLPARDVPLLTMHAEVSSGMVSDDRPKPAAC